MGIGMFLSLAGGLGLFLYGMSLMSDSIEKVAGASLRRILEIFTTNRFTGMLVGLIFTAVIQSSSACTVMVVSFVNSGLMTLYQAVGVIFGANIGTTITSQLVSFNLSAIAPVILLAGVIFMMISKKNEKRKQIAEVIIGFGILFVGLSSMSDAMSQMKDSPAIVNLLSSLDNPLFATFVGIVLTSVVQSSSVMVSIVLLLANQELLSLPISLYIVLGCNIGACTSAILASLAGKKDAKRAALIHLWFNIIGTVIIYIILAFAMDPVIKMISSISADNGRFVANAHTIFKIFQVIVLFPFGNQLVRLASICVPGEDEHVGYRENYQLKYIGNNVVFNPATAMVGVNREIERMASLAGENVDRAMNGLITLDEDDINEVYDVSKNITFLDQSITEYMVKINQTTLPIEDLKSLGVMFHIVNDIDRIGALAGDISDASRSRRESGAIFSKEALNELGQLQDMVDLLIRYSVETFVKSDDSHMNEIAELEEKINNKERELQNLHVQRLANGECTPEAGMVFSDVVSDLERVANHATNIAYAIQSVEE